MLEQIQRLATSIGITPAVGSTCETAEYFYLQHIQSRIEKFKIDLVTVNKDFAHYKLTIEHLFPFKEYFTNTPSPLFTGDWESDVESANGCFVHIKKIFEELADYRLFYCH